MKVKLETNKTKFDPEHRLELTTKEIRNYVFPRFKYFPKDKKHKMIPWLGKPGLSLSYRKTDRGVVVGIMENGYGVPDKFYDLNELEELMLPF